MRVGFGSKAAGVVLLAAALLAACGAGSDAPASVSGPAAATVAANLAAAETRAIAQRGGPDDPRRRALADPAFVPVSMAELLTWAEGQYPTLFPGPQPDLRYGDYTYRHYAATGNYAGGANGSVYLMGPVAAALGGDTRYLNEVYYYGEVATLTCTIHPDRCGRKDVVTLTVGGVQRSVIVYVPWKAQRSGRAEPAVVMLHGTTGDGERFFQISGWRAKADTEGLVAVFPTALTHCFWSDANRNGVVDGGEIEVTTKWNAGALGSTAPLCTAEQLARLDPATRALADHPLADDLGFMQAVLTHLAGYYPVDMRRVYATGFSNGGEMTGRMALQMADRFAAFAVAAANLNVAPVPPTRLPPVVFSVGSLDPAWTTPMGHPDGLPLTASLAGEAAWQDRLGTPWTTALKLSPTPVWSGQRVNGVRTSRFVYSPTSANGGTQRFTAWVIEGADHQYPNGSNHPVKMVDLLWDAFKLETLP